MSLGGGGQQQELQQLSEQIQQIEQQIEAINTEIESLRDEQSDIDGAIEALQSIENGATVQVPLGGGARVRAEILDVDEIAVDLGGGYAAERDREGAIDTLENKKETLDERIDELNEEISDLESESDRLEQQAQQLQQQALQQQMQSQGGDSE